ncbi:MAG: efflux RND transporter periplasmic adaptor subunit [Planctomycetota bacterium]
MSKVILPLVAVACGIGGAVLLVSLRKPVQSATPPEAVRLVRTTVATKSPITHEVRAFGTVTPRATTTLTAEVSGRILEVSDSFVTGGFVERNQLLLRVDPSTYDANLAGARAELARAEAALAREQAEADLAVREWERYGLGDPSPLTLRSPQLAEAHANVDFARARLQRAAIDVERTEVRAPYDGRIRERFVEHGQYIAPGAAVASVSSTDFAEVRLAITPDEVAYLNLPLQGQTTDSDEGPRVTLLSDFGGREVRWPAWITRTEGEVDERTRSIYAVARVRSPYAPPAEGGAPPLLAGLFVEAVILGQRAEAAVRLPRSAIHDGAVWIVDLEDRLRRRSVQILRLGREEVLIGDGLDGGEQVCVSALDLAVEGMKVRVVAAPPQEGTP